MPFECWITKVTHTHLEYVVIIVFKMPQWLRERALVLYLYVHCLSCLIYYVIQRFVAVFKKLTTEPYLKPDDSSLHRQIVF